MILAWTIEGGYYHIIETNNKKNVWAKIEQMKKKMSDKKSCHGYRSPRILIGRYTLDKLGKQNSYLEIIYDDNIDFNKNQNWNNDKFANLENVIRKLEISEIQDSHMNCYANSYVKSFTENDFELLMENYDDTNEDTNEDTDKDTDTDE